MKKLLTLLATTPLLLFPLVASARGGSITINPKAVCIDPGHGGTDPGATYNGVNEKDLNLTVALKLADKLTANGYFPHLTRTTDTTLDNAARYGYCNSTDSKIVISVHHNGSTNHATDYSTALWAGNDDKVLAQTVVNNVSAALGTTNTGTSRFVSGVLLKTNVPATISEGFFVSSDYEQALLPARLDTEVDGLYNGATSYLATH